MRDLATKTLYIAVMYEGPWDRITSWLYGIDRKTNELKFEMDDSKLTHRLRDFLGGIAEQRQTAWARRWAARDREPSERWKRNA
jgi:hypothetical protein